MPKVRGMRVFKKLVPVTIIEAAFFKGAELKVLSLNKCRLQRKKRGDANKLEKRDSYQDFKCNLKYLDCRETIGNCKMVDDYLSSQGCNLIQLGE